MKINFAQFPGAFSFSNLLLPLDMLACRFLFFTEKSPHPSDLFILANIYENSTFDFSSLLIKESFLFISNHEKFSLPL